MKRVNTMMSDLFDAATPPEPPAAYDGLYGPPEPVWAIPHPWGDGLYRMHRGSIAKATDAGDGRSWLITTRGKEAILIGTSIEQLGKAMPTLMIDGKKAHSK